MTYFNIRSHQLFCGRGGVRTLSLFDDRVRREFLGVLAAPKRFVCLLRGHLRIGGVDGGWGGGGNQHWIWSFSNLIVINPTRSWQTLPLISRSRGRREGGREILAALLLTLEALTYKITWSIFHSLHALSAPFSNEFQPHVDPCWWAFSSVYD